MHLHRRSAYRHAGALAASILLAIAGCAAQQWQRPAPANQDDSLAGHWLAHIDLPDDYIKDARTVLRLTPDGDGRFTGHSRPGALGDIRGFWPGLLGPWFAEDLDHGAWAHLREGRHHDDGSYTATLASPFIPDIDVQCRLAEQRLSCEPVSDAGHPVRLTARRTTPEALPVADYDRLYQRIREGTREVFYRPQALDEPQWQSFWDELREGLVASQDDFDAMAAFATAREALGVSHYALVRGNTSAEEAFAEASARHNTEEALTLTWPGNNVAVLKADTFSLPVEATRQRLATLFEQVSRRNPDALIIDLRGNSGGYLSSVLVAAHLMESPVPAGYLVTSRWWDENDQAPTPAEARRSLTQFSEEVSSVNFVLHHLRENAGMFMTVPALQPRYNGPTYVLTDSRSASATEPLVHILKHHGRATVIGETTAGKILSADMLEIAPGWRLRVPRADYYTTDGLRLEGRGVQPDIQVASEQALERALTLAGKAGNAATGATAE